MFEYAKNQRQMLRLLNKHLSQQARRRRARRPLTVAAWRLGSARNADWSRTREAA